MSLNSLKIAIFGECMVELTKQSSNIKQSFAGDTLNTAVYLARLCKPKATVEYISAVGDDSLSCDMRKYWTFNGVSSSYCLTVKDKNPGLYLISNTSDGERTFNYWRNDSAARYYFEQPESNNLSSVLSNFDAVFLSGISIAILDNLGRQKLFKALSHFKDNGGIVYFDPNYRPALWSSAKEAKAEIDRFCAIVAVIFPSLDDEEKLSTNQSVSKVISHYLALGVSEVVLKNGQLPGYVADAATTVECELTHSEEAVDTTGAGDSFNAAYIAARLAKHSKEDAFTWGNLLASYVVKYQGAIIPKNKMPPSFTR